MRRTNTVVATPGFVADSASIVRSGGGRQIDWSDTGTGTVNAVTGKKELRAGTRVRELPSGKLIAHTSATLGGALFGILETNAIQDDRSAALTGYGVIRGGAIYTALLPETLAATDLDALRPVGTGFSFETYNDNRAG